MGRKSATVWSYEGYDLMGSSEDPYYLIGFTKKPDILLESIAFTSGHILSPAGTVAYLGGKKTSAGFDTLHPVAPFLFRYAGMFKGGDDIYALWESGVDFKDEYVAVYYGHLLVVVNEKVEALLYTNRAGSGRVIEVDKFYFSHEDVPHSLFPLPYQKQMGWVA